MPQKRRDWFKGLLATAIAALLLLIIATQVFFGKADDPRAVAEACWEELDRSIAVTNIPMLRTGDPYQKCYRLTLEAHRRDPTYDGWEERVYLGDPNTYGGKP